MKLFPLTLAVFALMLGGAAQDRTISTTTAPVPWSGVEGLIWFDSFGTPAIDWVNRLIELEDGSILAVGFVNRVDGAVDPDWDIVLRKYTASGRVLWTKRLGGSGLDAAWTIREIAGGRFAIAGISSSGGAGDSDAYLLIADSEGNKVSEHWYGGAKDDRATDLAVTPDGGFLLVGQTDSSGAGERDVFVVRTDGEGNELWRRTYGDSGVDRGFFVAAVRGGYAISGITGTPDNVDYMLLKIDEAGNQLWRRAIAGEAMDSNHGVGARPDGSLLFTGYTKSWGSADNDVSAILFSPDGEILRHEIIGAAGDDRVQFSTVAADGSAWMTGYTRSFGGTGFDILVARLGRGGRFEPWLGAIGSVANDNGASITVARNGDLLLTGYTAAPSGGTAPPDAFVMRVRPDKIERRTEGVRVRSVPTR